MAKHKNMFAYNIFATNTKYFVYIGLLERSFDLVIFLDFFFPVNASIICILKQFTLTYGRNSLNISAQKVTVSQSDFLPEDRRILQLDKHCTRRWDNFRTEWKTGQQHSQLQNQMQYCLLCGQLFLKGSPDTAEALDQNYHGFFLSHITIMRPTLLSL